MTAERLVQALTAAAEGKQMTQANAAVELDFVIATSEGVTVEMGMDLNMEAKAAMEPFASYNQVTMTLDNAGEQTVETYQEYSLEEEGILVKYVHTDSTDSWEKMELETLTAQNSGYQYLKEVEPAALTLAESTQSLGGREVYVLSCTITGEQMHKAMDSFGGMKDMLALQGIGDVDFTALTIPTTYYIDAATYLPVQLEMEFQGMGEMMSSLAGSMLGVEAGDTEMEIEIPTCRVVYSGVGYDPVEIPAVPEVGLIVANQSSFNPDQGDGTYIIQESGSAVKITCPEGWTATEMAYNYVTLEADSGKQSVTYQMYGGVNGGYAFVSFIERNDVQDLLLNDNYGSHGNTTLELGDQSYGAVWVKCSDGTRLNYAWDCIGGGTNYLFVKTTDKTKRSMEASLETVLVNVEECQLIP